MSEYELDLLTTLISKTIANRNSRQYPNPSVGAMVVHGQDIIAEAYHLVHGDLHAEAEALVMAGDDARGATLLITLEPCTHFGKTPPCVDAIIKAKVSRVIWAIDDPNPKTFGKAKAILESHGIDVISNCMPDKARECIKEFYSFHALNRPYVYVKAAMSLDGMIAPHSNGLTYISSEQSLAVVHQLRSLVQAICVGANTIMVDQPRLSVRMGFSGPDQPKIVILDPHNLVDRHWVQGALDQGRSIVLFRSKGFDVQHSQLSVDLGLTDDKSSNWRHIFYVLYQMNIHGVLVEGGAGVFSSILSDGYFDEFWVTKVPMVFGKNAISFFPHFDAPSLSLSLRSVQAHENDVVMKYQNQHAFSI